VERELMRRIVLALFAICLAGAAWAGWPNSGRVYPIASGTCSQATTFLARTSGLSGTETAAYKALICGMVTDGTWSLMDALYIFATNNTTTAKLNLVSTSYTATVNGTLTFTADTGWTGDGSTGYLDTGFNPTSASGHYSLNSATLGVYDLTSRAANISTQIGVLDLGASSISYIAAFFSGGGSWDMNGLSYNSTSGVTTSQGSWLASRTTNMLISYYQNGSLIGSNPAEASVAIQNADVYIFCYNNSGPMSVTSDQLSAAWIGGGLNSTQAANVQSRINNYMKALGINVY
jgi:hypothetical protein